MSDLLKKYAELTIQVGANVQPNQTVMIQAIPEHVDFVRLLSEEAYKQGAKRVVVKFNDDYLTRLNYINQDIETLKQVSPWFLDEYQEYMDEGYCRINVYAPNPGVFEDVDSTKMAEAMQARSIALKKVQEYSMANRGQWTLVSLPTKEWAQKVFPELEAQDAYDKLLDAILYTARVEEDSNPIEVWKEHNDTLTKQNKKLNDYNFKSLHFKNGIGTNIEVGLVKDHIWCGGKEESEKGYVFNPNIPTEESFTMPDKFNVNGKVYSTKPLNYQGRLIDEFWLEFKDGAVVNYGAEKEEEVLKALLEMDEGSNRLGEIALISHDSPISNLNILFYNTLFDENASCHMALGASYPMNIKNGTNLDRDTLDSMNSNNSIVHEDFMFGSEDMEIIGTTYDGEEVKIFEEGNFII